MVTFDIKVNPGFGALFMQHVGLLCTLHLAVYSSVFPQAPTRGQDNTSVQISEGEREVGVGGVEGWRGSFPP